LSKVRHLLYAESRSKKTNDISVEGGLLWGGTSGKEEGERGVMGTLSVWLKIN
jgi:hypothetical protein